MTQFVTFYSYKGGVGRSLALANVAWLLATHKTEPARVLVIDFDLGAPGLHHIFGARKRSANGIVDYISDYLATAELPDVTRYIHSTRFPSIDILPAGKMGSGYQRKLELINWTELYDQAYGFEFFERTKRAIAESSARYDYVLIDSLTGFSDVGGICVRQLPETVVMLFRLNQQNLDGIETVYSLVQRSVEQTSKAISVIPVITPAWPFLDTTLGAWIKGAQSIFKGVQISEIVFDGGLSLGEAIVAQSQANSPVVSRVVQNYQTLASRVRALNPTDPLTLWNRLARQPLYGRAIEETAGSYLSLLQRRLDSAKYWGFLRSLVGAVDHASKGKVFGVELTRLRDFINNQCEKKNKLALLARASVPGSTWLQTPEDKGSADLETVLSIDPNYVPALRQRAAILEDEGDRQAALVTLKQAFSVTRKPDAKRAQIAEDIGNLFLANLESKEAGRYLEIAVLQSEAPDARLLIQLSRAHYLNGAYGEALTSVQRALIVEPGAEQARMLVPQLWAAMGRMEEARAELVRLSERRGMEEEAANLAEAYVAVDPNLALRFIREKRREIPRDGAALLTFVARFVLKPEMSMARAKERTPLSKEQLKGDYWDIYELAALLRRLHRERILTQEQLQFVQRVVMSASISPYLDDEDLLDGDALG